MSVNAREEEYEHVEIYEKPALFTDSRIDRLTVPKGFFCYDLRGSDYDPSRPVTIQNSVVVNHAGTILTPEPVPIPQEGFLRLNGKLNFLGESMTLTGFCKEHGINLAPVNQKFHLRPASPDEAGLFFSQNEKDTELGTVGHLRADFGHGGGEFWSTWWPHNEDVLNTPKFKEELQELVDELRKNGPLSNLSAMSTYCRDHSDGKLSNSSGESFGYVTESDHYRYCLRCTPAQGEYNAYLYIYDKRVQEMNELHRLMETEQDLPEMCFSTLPSDGSLICIKHGETGYYRSDWDTGDSIRNRELADYNNKRLGVSKMQEEAMVTKSMCGWKSQEYASKETGLDQTMGGM